MLQCCSIDIGEPGTIREKGTGFSRPKSKLAIPDFAGVRRLPVDAPFSPTRRYPVRVAIYARVSTDDKGQDPENQLRELRDWCAKPGREIAHEYVDYVSGRKGAKQRPAFAQMFEDAEKHQFDVVLVWA